MLELINRVVRDNAFVNPIGRRIAALAGALWRSAWLTDKYRIYGDVELAHNGVRFRVHAEGDDFIANDIYYKRPHVAAELALLEAVTAHSRYFIDIGANTGMFSVFAARAKPGLQVIAFEPHPGNFERLRRNISLNPGAAVDARRFALGPNRSSIRFTVPRDGSLSTVSSANDNFTRNFHQIEHTTISVEQTTLDEACGDLGLGPADFVKLDVETYEMDVLEGADRILRSARPLLFVEVHRYDWLVRSRPALAGKLPRDHHERIEKFLAERGYSPYVPCAGGVMGLRRLSEVTDGTVNTLFAQRSMPGTVVPLGQIGSMLTGASR